MKQANLFAHDAAKSATSMKVGTPIYEPGPRKPHLIELVDASKTKRLERRIEQSNVEDDERAFLIAAAQRHNVFHYQRIADYYAHSNPEIQDLMEQSALVVVDFERAIELGYVDLSEDIRKQYLEVFGG